MEKKTPSPFKRDIDRAYKRLQLASMVLGNVSEAYDTGDLKEAYRNAFEFAYHAERLTLLARSLPALTGSPRRKTEDGAPDQRGAAASHRLYRRGLVRRGYACASAKKGTWRR